MKKILRYRAFVQKRNFSVKMTAVIQDEEGGPETMTVNKVDFPPLKKDYIWVKIEATALNRADILQRRGFYPPLPGETKVMGLEGAGYILRSPEEFETKEYKNNKRVMALLPGGGYADVAVWHKDHIIEIPDEMDFASAAAIPETWLTSYQLINFVGQAKTGDFALVHAAASGVGVSALQLCRSQGIKPIAVASSPEKLSMAMDLGAIEGINYKETPDFSDRIMEITENKGVNLILDPIGAQNFEFNLKSAAMDCKWVLFAGLGGVRLKEVNLGKLLLKRIHFLSSTLKNRSDAYKTELIRAFEKDWMEKFRTGELKPVIDSVYKMSQVREAHLKMEKNLNIGKIVLVNDF